MAQNPAGGNAPFFLRTVHDQSGAKCLPFKPPDTEPLFIHVAAINHLVIASRIAPKFIREVKSIREEIGNVDKRLEFSHHVADRKSTRLNGIVPMLHPHAAVEYL